MTVRFAVIEDVPALVEAGSRMHALTRFRHQPYDRARIARSFADLILNGKGRYAFFVAESKELGIAGALIGVMEQQIFSALYTASVMHIDVLPEARMGGHGVRLLRAFEKWARNRQAFEICFGINSEEGLEALGRFASRMNYRLVGGNYVKSAIIR